MELSAKGQQLVSLYEQMVRDGYDRTDGIKVDVAFSDFELRVYRPQLQELMAKFAVRTVLDYGSGGSDWQAKGFDDSGQSAIEYFSLENAYKYDPGRQLDERQKVDCVVSFDVLEHIFINDVPTVLRDLFSYAENLIILNVACYAAAAMLPNGENAHVTVRSADWWKGMVDSISIEYPQVSVLMITSAGWRQSSAGPVWRPQSWLDGEPFVVP
ncbi:MAG: hypothetical protein HQ504_09600 [Rhodospirillaceae bacterium]|nr:hypothetical protein [Rhodospirillaceae bacterium]